MSYGVMTSVPLTGGKAAFYINSRYIGLLAATSADDPDDFMKYSIIAGFSPVEKKAVPAENVMLESKGMGTYEDSYDYIHAQLSDSSLSSRVLEHIDRASASAYFSYWSVHPDYPWLISLVNLGNQGDEEPEIGDGVLPHYPIALPVAAVTTVLTSLGVWVPEWLKDEDEE